MVTGYTSAFFGSPAIGLPRSGRGGSGFAQGERLLGRGEHVLSFVLSFGVM